MNCEICGSKAEKPTRDYGNKDGILIRHWCPECLDHIEKQRTKNLYPDRSNREYCL